MNPKSPEITFDDLYENHERVVAKREAKNKQIKLPSWLAFGDTETRLFNINFHISAEEQKAAAKEAVKEGIRKAAAKINELELAKLS